MPQAVLMFDLLSRPINFFFNLEDDPSIFIGEVWLRLVCLSFGSAGRFLSIFFFDLVRLKPWMVNPLRPVFLLLVVACGGLVEWWIFCLHCCFFGGPFGCCFGVLMDYGEVSASGFLLFLCERGGVCGIPMGAGSPVSFYFRVGGSVAGCGASFRSPVSVMADLLGVFLFLVAERRRRKTHERRSFSTSPAEVLAAILWVSVLEFVAGCLPVHTECLSVRPSIRRII